MKHATTHQAEAAEAPTGEGRQAPTSWLLSATKARDRARMEWHEAGVTMLPCGVLFSAVRLTERLVHAACGTDQADVVNAYLAHTLLGGPVIHDPRRARYYTLVPATPAMRWPSTRDTEALGRGCYLGVPRPDLTTYQPQAWHPYWSVPMVSAGRLCAPDAVAQLVAFGRFRIASEASG